MRLDQSIEVIGTGALSLRRRNRGTHQGDQAKADAKVTYLDQVRELKRKRQAASEKLDDLRQSGGSAAKELKDGVERAIKDLGDAFEKAVENF